MSGNYSALLTKAGDVKTKYNLMVTAQEATSVAQIEADQAKAAHDAFVAEFSPVLDSVTVSQQLLTSLQTKLTALIAARTAASTTKATAKAAYDAANGVVSTAEGQLPTINTSITTQKTALNGLVNTLNTKTGQYHTALNTKETLEQDVASKQADYDAKLKLWMETPDTDSLKSSREDAKDDAFVALTAAQGLLNSYVSNALATAQTELTAAQTAVKDQEDVISDLVQEYRSKEAEIKTKKADLETKKVALQKAVNDLEDIEGVVIPLNVNYPYETDTVFDDNPNPGDLGFPGSKIHVLKKTVSDLDAANLDTIQTDIQGSIAAKLAEKSTAESTLIAKKSDETTKVNAHTSERTGFAVLLQSQAAIEVDAAVALLKDFLAKKSVVVAAAPTVESSVVTLIDKTCPNSKVRQLVGIFNSAYYDKAEYDVILSQIRADPVAYFFHSSDACFVELTPEDAETLQQAVSDSFSKKAREVLGSVSSTVTAATKYSFIQALLCILVVVGIAAAILYLLGVRI